MSHPRHSCERRHGAALVIAAAAAVAAVAGCGGGGDSSTPVAVSAAPTPVAARSAGTLAAADVTTLNVSPLFGDAGGARFDDAVGVQTELTGVTIRHGYWIDAVQAQTADGALPVHGGDSGLPSSFTLERDEYLVAIHGRQGANPANPAIAQISFVTSQGRTYGPYGQGIGQGETTPFYWRVPRRGRIVGFSGRSGSFVNAIGVQYVVDPVTSPVVASAVVGAPGGTPFTDSVDPSAPYSLDIYSGSWVDGLQLTQGTTSFPLRGSASGSMSEVFVSEPAAGEDLLDYRSITRIWGQLGGDPVAPAISQMSIDTRASRYSKGPFGMALGQDPRTPFELRVPSGHRLVGLTGRAGTYLNAIGLLTQRVDAPAVQTSRIAGIAAGTAFADPVVPEQWLDGFIVYHGTGVDGIQGIAHGMPMPLHGRKSGEATSVNLDPGEFLVSVRFRWDESGASVPIISGLVFRTNKGRELGPFGNPPRENTSYQWTTPNSGRIVGFTGRVGDDNSVNALGVQYVVDVSNPEKEGVSPVFNAPGYDVTELSSWPFGSTNWVGGAELRTDNGIDSIYTYGYSGRYADYNNFSLSRGETLVRMFGSTTRDTPYPTVATVGFVSDWGITYGPYGGVANSYTTTPFEYSVPPGTGIRAIDTDALRDWDTYTSYYMRAIGVRYAKKYPQQATSPAFGSPLGFEFHDLVADGQVLTGVRISAGDWVDSIQALATPVDLARHGGNGGTTSTFQLQPGEHLVRIFGLQGTHPDVPAIAQISFETSTGRVFGPYGAGMGQDPTRPFDFRVPARARVVGFSGRASEYLNAIAVQIAVD